MRDVNTQPSTEQPDFDDALRRRLEQASDIARAAVVEVNREGVGKHLEAVSEAPFTMTHRFAAEIPGYRGWHWACVLASVPGDTGVTVDEIALLPGSDALVAPEWVPWEERIEPGDLGAGDLLPPPEGDERLVPGQMLSGDDELDDIAGPIGVGRRQHLSLEGRAAAAARWRAERGPDSEIARSAPASCATCGFFVPLAGSLGTMFGACANEYSADGRVVSLEYGCGAHSDVSVSNEAAQRAGDAYDDAAVDVVVLPQQLEGARRAAASGRAADARDSGEPVDGGGSAPDGGPTPSGGSAPGGGSATDGGPTPDSGSAPDGGSATDSGSAPDGGSATDGELNADSTDESTPNG